METIVFIRTIAKGKQAFYLRADNREYYLFSQDYRKSVKEYFAGGIIVNVITDYSTAHSTAVRKTLDKLKVYIPYVEKEYGIAVMDKTKNKQRSKKNAPYKRQPFNWRNIDFEESEWDDYEDAV